MLTPMPGNSFPFVSVVIPMRNAESTIADQLAALAAQEYAGDWEVVIADNGSTDRSAEIAASWQDQFPSLRVVDASSKAGGPHARNVGASEARGEILLMCDADDVVVGRRWIATLAEGLETYDVVRGVQDFEALNSPEVVAWYRSVPRWGGGPPISDTMVPGGNFGIRAAAWAELGGYSEDVAMGDYDFSIRAARAGLRIGEVPEAVIATRHRSDLRTLTSQHFARGRNLVATASLHPGEARSAGDTVRLGLSYLSWLILHAPAAAVSRKRRGQWLQVGAYCLGWLSAQLGSASER